MTSDSSTAPFVFWQLVRVNGDPLTYEARPYVLLYPGMLEIRPAG